MTDQVAALRVFVRVARTGGFSRAARELGLSQPSTSRIVAALEQDIGAALFMRSTRAVTLTEAGADYLQRVEPILDALDEANHAARGTGELRGVLRVGLSSNMAIRAVIPRLQGFADAHPALRIELLVEDRRQDLVGGGVDVALRFGPLADSAAVARRLAAWPRVIAAAPGYLARHGTPQAPADLASHQAITSGAEPGSGWTFRKDGREVSVRLGGRLFATALEATIAAAVAGLGIVATSAPSCAEEFASGALVRLLPDWDAGAIDVHAVFAAGRAASPAARAFADFLARQFASLRPISAPRPS